MTHVIACKTDTTARRNYNAALSRKKQQQQQLQIGTFLTREVVIKRNGIDVSLILLAIDYRYRL